MPVKLLNHFLLVYSFLSTLWPPPSSPSKGGQALLAYYYAAIVQVFLLHTGYHPPESYRDETFRKQLNRNLLALIFSHVCAIAHHVVCLPSAPGG